MSKEYLQHPLSAAFPGMTQKELAELTDDIANYGQRDAIVLFEGQILDGFHRYQACRACGRVPNYVALPEGINPVAYVTSKNLHRRHLSGSQRAAAIVACNEWHPMGHLKKNSEVGAELPATAKNMATTAAVSIRTVEQAKAAQRAGLGQAVRDGVMSAPAAAQVAKLPEAERKEVIANPETFKEKLVAHASRQKQEPEPEPEVELVDAEWDENEVGGEQVTVSKEYIALLEESHREFEHLANSEDGEEIMVLMAETKRLKAEVETLKARTNGLMNEKNEAIKAVKKWKGMFERLEKRYKEDMAVDEAPPV